MKVDKCNLKNLENLLVQMEAEGDTKEDSDLYI